MTDTATQQGMNPALKIILIVAGILLALTCMGGLLVAWFVSMGVEAADGAVKASQTEATMMHIAAVVETHRAEDGGFVDSLDALHGELDGLTTDAWDNAISYERSPDGESYTLTSLGADGVPGGEGPDADIVHVNAIGPDER